MKCPYRTCDFEGSEQEVDEHVAYCTSILTNDPDHREENLR